MPVPTVYATALFDKLDEFLLEFAEHDQEVNAGVMSVGEAAAYAEVWEYGNIRQTKKGPKTVLGINPDGKEVWLSIQAPHGYIKVNEPFFWMALQDELSKVKFDSTDARGITEELAAAGKKAAKRFIPFLKGSAPVDSGKLADSFEVVEDGDEMLDDSDDSRTLTIG
jgi:hypothetical protein